MKAPIQYCPIQYCPSLDASKEYRRCVESVCLLVTEACGWGGCTDDDVLADIKTLLAYAEEQAEQVRLENEQLNQSEEI